MGLIDDILTSDAFAADPPVLLDVGASGAIHPVWKPFARHAVCLVFDADDREMGYVVREGTGFRKLIVCNRVVTDTDAASVPFHLTRSPYCSSSLHPDTAALADWEFHRLFAVESTRDLPAITLRKVLADNRLARVDWFKTDSQGTDLRIFTSLGDELIQRVLVAEFEPGILDSYQGEDKLHRVMAAMDAAGFWMAAATVRGVPRISRDLAAGRFGALTHKALHLLDPAPGWAEVTYLPRLARLTDRRDLLLAWVFAHVLRQDGFALALAADGCKRHDDALFRRMLATTEARIRHTVWRRLPGLALRRVLGKIARLGH
jgi:hypothetical protein